MIESVEGVEILPPVAAVLAHPGHEMVSFGWMARLQPEVAIVTDGSGRAAEPRIEATRELLATGLGSPGPVFGRWRDLELYEEVAGLHFAPFTELRDELADWCCSRPVRTLLCDSYEHAILAHDLVFVVAAAAVNIASQRGHAIDLLEIPNQLPAEQPRPKNPRPVASLRLSDEGLAHKIAVARAYPSDVVQHEVEEFLRERGGEDFRVEALLRPVARGPRSLADDPIPEWERHGDELRRRGVYRRTIRLRQHLVPLAEALGFGVAKPRAEDSRSR